MSTYTSSDELALIPANRISYARHYGSTGARTGLVQRMKAFFQRQAAMREMTALTDRELHDIGLSRSDLEHVFDQGFVSRLAD